MDTLDSVWLAVAGEHLSDQMLDWPPDIFALTETILDRTEAYRFAVSPPTGRQWPPAERSAWDAMVTTSGIAWCTACECDEPTPNSVSEAWSVVEDNTDVPISTITDGQAWGLCEALLTLHAIADEACHPMTCLPASDPLLALVRARANELLARRGSLSRISRDRLRVLPKARTVDGGISHRSLSRYACVVGPAVDVVWHRVPTRRQGATQQHANILLLPWPLRVRARDFQPLPHSIERPTEEPFGFFEFWPSESLDFDLLDGVLNAACDEVGRVDVVVLPESAIAVDDVDELEARLARHRVGLVASGVRERSLGSGSELPSNRVHIGVRFGDCWWRFRQNKHHRWYLDQSQIDQYHLGAQLDPGVRWWEAMSVPRRTLQVIELGAGVTFVAVICEDLARLDEVSELLRTVGPTLVVTVLLDGPQIPSRWTARYASVLADDPGSAVLTLTSYGFSQRSRPHGRAPSPVVALWKDPARGFQEIPLQSGAQGALLVTAVGKTRRRSADGRMPVDDVADLVVAGVHQVKTSASPSGVPTRTEHAPGNEDLTILSAWADAIAETMTHSSPRELRDVLDNARPGAPWRRSLGLDEPSGALSVALNALDGVIEPTRESADEPLAKLARTLIPPARSARN